MILGRGVIDPQATRIYLFHSSSRIASQICLKTTKAVGLNQSSCAILTNSRQIVFWRPKWCTSITRWSRAFAAWLIVEVFSAFFFQKWFLSVFHHLLLHCGCQKVFFVWNLQTGTHRFCVNFRWYLYFKTNVGILIPIYIYPSTY